MALKYIPSGVADSVNLVFLHQDADIDPHRNFPSRVLACVANDCMGK